MLKISVPVSIFSCESKSPLCSAAFFPSRIDCAVLFIRSTMSRTTCRDFDGRQSRTQRRNDGVPILMTKGMSGRRRGILEITGLRIVQLWSSHMYRTRTYRRFLIVSAYSFLGQSRMSGSNE